MQRQMMVRMAKRTMWQKRMRRMILLALPWLLQSTSAHAWGLYTHVFFAQWLVWGVPFLDGELRRAVARYPRLVMAGACLPDLALVGRLVRTDAFDRNHCWDNARLLLASAETDAERALAVGFYSHLFADVVAHHHFVPAHERLWVDWPMVAHAASEWAMDAHVSRQVLMAPAALLRGAQAEVAPWLARHYGLSVQQVIDAMRWLANADALLRTSRLSHGLYITLSQTDSRARQRFDYFLRETHARFAGINRVLAGDLPQPDANGGCAQVAQYRLSAFSDAQLRLGQPLPVDCFYKPV